MQCIHAVHSCICRGPVVIFNSFSVDWHIMLVYSLIITSTNYWILLIYPVDFNWYFLPFEAGNCCLRVSSPKTSILLHIIHTEEDRLRIGIKYLLSSKIQNWDKVYRQSSFHEIRATGIFTSSAGGLICIPILSIIYPTISYPIRSYPILSYPIS